MKRTLVRFVCVTNLAVLGMQSVSAAPMASITESWHNLGSSNSKAATPNGGVPANHSTATSEVCVFCHTPHGSDVTAVIPSWNRYQAFPTEYKRYSSLGTVTFDATEGSVGSSTIACLSCHDGTQAIDTIINRPGSGGYQNPPIRIPGGEIVGADVDPDGTLRNDMVQHLGTDLSDDHPVSMQYGGGGVSIITPDGPTRDPDFTGSSPSPENATLNHMRATPSSGLNTLWWIERYSDSLINGVRDREDIILYTRRDIAGDATLQPTVECGSCHDPHNVKNPTFLRVSTLGPGLNPNYPNANGGPSALCMSCHTK